MRYAVMLGMLGSALGVVLTPPYFNIAERRKIEASSTCGEGVDRPELYCKLVGANQDWAHSDNILIQGQVCDECDPNREDRAHPPENAIDGTENYWMSPPLSRGTEYNQVTLTISLGQEFHVAYVLIKMGNSPRPGVWALERSADNGKTYKPWQYFADTLADCEYFFGKESLEPITRDDSVSCVTSYSKIVPLEDGEILTSLLQHRPSANDFFNSSVLQEFTRATNVRLRLIRTKTLLGHLMSVARQDPTVTRRYFYSIKDISIGGRCRCNGHADLCDIPSPDDPYKLLCRCQHNTCGDNCERCCPNKVQKAWQQSKANKLFVCEECNCFGHSDQCVYNETVDAYSLSLDIHGNYDGGGVCQNCRHNTEGINCEKCNAGFYRPHGRHLNQTDVCEPCRCESPRYTGNCAEGTGKCECQTQFKAPDCDSCSYGYYGYPDCVPCLCSLNGTLGYYCEPEGGQCPCKPNFKGKFCNACSEGFYKFPNCLGCECNPIGSLDDQCDVDTGECECNSNYGGIKCSSCANGYYSFPTCTHCNCDTKGTEYEICDKQSGECLCKEGFGGARCDQCLPGYRGYPDCEPCGCSEVGSSSKVCDITGKCRCLDNYAGRTCHSCIPGFYSYPDCLSCDCDYHGSMGVSCDAEGQCQCKPLFTGKRCEKCKEGLFNFPICEECNCHPAGVMENFPGCGNLSRQGELCQCKPRTQGRICDTCRPLYWNLQVTNPDGCQDCECHTPGVMGGISVCASQSGQCTCKQFVTSRKCDVCADGMYNLQDSNLFGCSDCACDVGGSTSSICNKLTGLCQCHARITGRDCSHPLQAHYYPTLHQERYEAEDGLTPDNTPVHYGFDNALFPDFSWKGYAVFSDLKNHIILDVFILRSSLYRLILRYVNPHNVTVGGKIILTPENPADEEQVTTALFKHSDEPVFSVASRGSNPAPLVLNPGRWDVHIINNKPILLDYIVLMPQEFYEGTLLQDKVIRPCEVGSATTLCRHYGYPNLENFDRVFGGGAFLDQDGFREPIQEFFDDEDHLKALNLSSGAVALVGNDQPEVHFELSPIPGSYVLLVNYLSSKRDPGEKAAEIRTEIRTPTDQTKAMLRAPSCPHSWPCRQVLIDKDGQVAKFDFDTNFVTIVFKLDDLAAVGIESVVAVPLNEWSLDFIKPSPICVMKEGKCLKANYLENDFKKIEIEAGNEYRITSPSPSGISNIGVNLVYLDPNDNGVSVNGKVPAPGNYIFIVHFYQPNFPDFKLTALVQNGQIYDAELLVKHCPSHSGCRAVIVDKNGNNQFQLTENFMLTFKEPERSGVWLDYILIVPVDKFNEQHLTEQPVDKTGLFIKECGQNHFYMNSNASNFCKSSVFSLTSAYNSEALSCGCHNLGSLSYKCEEFGGQCSCRPNVIGRKCEQCRPGYYGFPDCKPCSCPALCHTETGSCLCPPNVMGDMCDQCEPDTFGYHSIIGCEPCNCSPYGVLRGDLQCDLFNGTCSCKKNVVGRKCDNCKSGHFSFPDCAECDCDLRGTTDEICDKETADCYCKENVDGQACDVCREGTFNIEAKNKKGCTKCFCFGKIAHCTSSRLYRSQITGMDGWSLSSINVTKTVKVKSLDAPIEKVSQGLGVDLTDDDLVDKVVYFTTPEIFLGNQLKAYGGFLKYSVFFTAGPFGDAHLSSPDMILEGGGTYLLHYSVEQPAANEIYPFNVEMSEGSFTQLNGLPASREQLMLALEDLRAIHIRATYWKYSITTRLENVSLDSASEQYNGVGGVALSVEQCSCPSNYQGLSCEECAPGYYRAQTGPFGGFCIPCQCNNHAATCDVVTGICHDCQNNTVGDHCDQCDVGYYGNATIGAPDDCMICACPLPFPSNNFATGCEVSEDGERISCECKEGYYGGRCEVCAKGYYGNPELQGDTCKPCQCSGNINPEEQGACDSLTGKCIRCLHNTYGDSCQICAPGYFGDAVSLKNCQSCVCDPTGTERCDNQNGICECRPNVQGDKCDRCALHHYAFNSSKGCKPCDCGAASDSLQCEDETGQCRCRHGVDGLRCDKCVSGYWNYTSEGCTRCACNTEYSIGLGCNPTTGHCECLQGVEGERCDHCRYRWVLKQGEGCFECNRCIHDLLDVVDNLAQTFQPVREDFQSLAATHLMTQRLKFINDTVDELLPNVTSIAEMRVDMDPINKVFEEMRENTSRLERKTEFALSKLKEALGGKVKEKAMDTEAFVQKAVDMARETVQVAITIADSFEKDGGFGVPNSEFELALAEAKQILQKLEEKEPAYDSLEVEEGQLARAKTCLSDMQSFKEPLDSQDALLKSLRNNISKIDERLEDLKQHTATAKQQAFEIDKKNKKNKEADIEGKHDKISKLNEMAKQLSQDNLQLLLATAGLLAMAGNSLGNLSTQKYLMGDSMGRIESRISERFGDLDSLEKLVADARDKADELQMQAQELERLAKESQYDSNAIDAVNAYKNIVEVLRNASVTAEEARVTAQNAIDLSRGLDEESSQSSNRSRDLYEEAQSLYLEAVENLRPELDEAREHVTDVNRIHQKNVKDLESIESGLSKTPEMPKVSGNVLDLASEADKSAEEVEDLLEGILPQLENDKNQAEQLHNNREEARIAIEQANIQLSQVSNILPNISKLAESLRNRPEGQTEDVKLRLDDLKKRIRLARELADSVKLGVKFFRNTTLQLRHTDNLPDQGINSGISIYFNTSDPRGLLFFLGNEKATSRRYRRAISTGDFMALEIENGYLKFTADLGSGVSSINIDDKKVNDGKWYHVVVERTGKKVHMTLKWQVKHDSNENIQESSRNGVIKGNSTILNLDRDSKLFLGGLPAGFSAPDEISSSSFRGNIQELGIGETDVGLWNFVESANIHPSRERNELESTVTSTGYRFGVDSFVELNNTYRIEEKTSIYLHFKTFAKEGLIFLTVKGGEFLSLELREGRVYFQFDLGGGHVTLGTDKTYNDGIWHVVEATRVRETGNLRVDGILTQQDTGPPSFTRLGVGQGLFFGGYPEVHDLDYVTNTHFDGCIDQVLINSGNVDLTSHIRASNVIPGCPQKVASVVSFEKGTRGYAKWKDLSVGSEELQLILRFRTPSQHGILAYLSNGPASASLSLVDGQISFQSGQASVKSESTSQYNDSQWHVVMATLDSVSLKLFINDYESYSSVMAPQPIRLLNADLYFGGVPSEVNAPASYSPQFHGCIGDATVNNIIVNFGNLTQNETSGAFIGKCILDSPTVHIYKPLPPIRPRPPLIEESTFKPPVPLPRPTVPQPPIKEEDDDHDDEDEEEEEEEEEVGMVEPVYIEGCQLPLHPRDDANPKQVGYRFGTKYGSRLEYDKFPKSYGSKYDLSIDIKTAVDEGVIFYAANKKLIDFIVLYMKDGQVHYGLDYGSGVALISSSKMVNDSKWHTIKFRKRSERGVLLIDGEKVGEATPPGNTKTVNVEPPYYLGAVDPKIINDTKIGVKNILKGVSNNFEGCLKGLKMDEVLLQPKANIDVIPCSDKVEEGIFFSSDGGYIKQYEKFHLRAKMNIRLEVKPRNPSGVLVSIHGKKHYLILELVNGSVRFVLGDGVSEIVSTFTPTPLDILCDGQWHKITALKARSVLTLGLDDSYTNPIVGQGISGGKTSSNQALFIGGHRLPYDKLKGVTATKSYVGCIKNLMINDKEEKILSQNVYGNVTFGVCPLN